MILKILKSGDLEIAPITAAEAVLIKKDGKVTSINKLILTRGEDNTLQLVDSATGLLILHRDTITPNSDPMLAKIKYNETGHITEALELKIWKTLE